MQKIVFLDNADQCVASSDVPSFAGCYPTDQGFLIPQRPADPYCKDYVCADAKSVHIAFDGDFGSEKMVVSLDFWSSIHITSEVRQALQTQDVVFVHKNFENKLYFTIKRGVRGSSSLSAYSSGQKISLTDRGQNAGTVTVDKVYLMLSNAKPGFTHLVVVR